MDALALHKAVRAVFGEAAPTIVVYGKGHQVEPLPFRRDVADAVVA